MTRTQMLPLLLIIINIASAGIYLADGDWKRCIYWISASVLTACVTF